MLLFIASGTVKLINFYEAAYLMVVVLLLLLMQTETVKQLRVPPFSSFTNTVIFIATPYYTIRNFYYTIVH